MIELRTTAEQDEIDLSGSPADLTEAQRMLRAVAAGGLSATVLAADEGADPRPYDLTLGGLEVRRSETLVKVSITGKRVTITGSPEGLEALAALFDLDQSAESGVHSHFEWYEGHPLIAPDSTPLVVGVTPSRAGTLR